MRPLLRSLAPKVYQPCVGVTANLRRAGLAKILLCRLDKQGAERGAVSGVLLQAVNDCFSRRGIRGRKTGTTARHPSEPFRSRPSNSSLGSKRGHHQVGYPNITSPIRRPQASQSARLAGPAPALDDSFRRVDFIPILGDAVGSGINVLRPTSPLVENGTRSLLQVSSVEAGEHFR